jgi:FkbM family methyltransferase
MSILRFVNSVRESRGFTRATVPLLTPIRRAAQWVDREIGRKFKVNGGTLAYDGIRLRFPPDVGVGFSSSIHWHGTNGFEPNTWRVLRYYLERSSHFLDVGANIGFYSVLAQLVAPKLRVDSFEPVPSIAAKNHSFHAANGLDDPRIHSVALSNHDGVGAIYLPLSQSSRDEETTATVREDSWQARKEHRQIGVKLQKLDTVALDLALTTPLVIKIDVEDYEAAVLTGAMKTIETHRPAMVIEMLPRPHGNRETLEVLRELRYAAFAITDCGLFRFGDTDFFRPRTFTDFLLLPSDSVGSDLSYAPYAEIRLIQSASGTLAR